MYRILIKNVLSRKWTVWKWQKVKQQSCKVSNSAASASKPGLITSFSHNVKQLYLYLKDENLSNIANQWRKAVKKTGTR